jgi:hypothetical protein
VRSSTWFSRDRIFCSMYSLPSFVIVAVYDKNNRMSIHEQLTLFVNFDDNTSTDVKVQLQRSCICLLPLCPRFDSCNMQLSDYNFTADVNTPHACEKKNPHFAYTICHTIPYHATVYHVTPHYMQYDTVQSPHHTTRSIIYPYEDNLQLESNKGRSAWKSCDKLQPTIYLHGRRLFSSILRVALKKSCETIWCDFHLLVHTCIHIEVASSLDTDSLINQRDAKIHRKKRQPTRNKIW